MFLVFNKQKIYSYLVAFATVVVLLGMAKIYKSKSGEIIETISNNEKIEENIDVNMLILNDRWTDNDVYQILQILKKNGCSCKFYITRNWKEKHEQSINQIQNYGFEIVEYE